MKKQTKLWVRVLSLALVVLMLGSMLLACKKKDENPADTTNGGDVVNPDANAEKKNVLDGVRYNGETVRVYGWIPANIAEQVQEFNAQLGVVEQNIYQRLDETKNQLNIKVVWKEEKNGAKFIQAADTANQTGDYDIYACYSTDAASLTVRGVAKNLLSFDTMDFNHSGWAGNLLDQATMFNKLFFCTGDISTNLIFMTPCVFVNMDMVETWHINEKIQSLYGEDNLYDLVREGKWTYDAMYKLIDGIWQDTDSSNGTRTDGDTYGLGTYKSLLPSFYSGAGYTFLETDEEGIYLSEDYVDVDAMDSLLKDVNSILRGGYCLYKDSYSVPRVSFAAGLHLFSLAPASHAYMTHYHTNDLEYSAIPSPKYKEETEGYSTHHLMNYTSYIVATGSVHPEIAASFLQCMTEWSYDTTRIAIFENTMKARFAQGDSDIVQMWEMIVDSQSFDLGRIYQSQFGLNGESITNSYMGMFTIKLHDGRTDWANIVDSYEDDMKRIVTDLNEKLKALPD